MMTARLFITVVTLLFLSSFTLNKAPVISKSNYKFDKLYSSYLFIKNKKFIFIAGVDQFKNSSLQVLEFKNELELKTVFTHKFFDKVARIKDIFFKDNKAFAVMNTGEMNIFDFSSKVQLIDTLNLGNEIKYSEKQKNKLYVLTKSDELNIIDISSINSTSIISSIQLIDVKESFISNRSFYFKNANDQISIVDLSISEYPILLRDKKVLLNFPKQNKIGLTFQHNQQTFILNKDGVQIFKNNKLLFQYTGATSSKLILRKQIASLKINKNSHI